MNDQTAQSLDDQPHDELRSAWNDVVEEIRNADPDEAHERGLWERRRELWEEMERRVDVEPPECPECGGQSWSQSMGDPKHCDQCGLDLGERHMDTIEAIDEYWDTVLAGPGVDDGE